MKRKAVAPIGNRKREFHDLPLAQLRVSDRNCRIGEEEEKPEEEDDDDEQSKITDLANSIRMNGLLCPLTVVPIVDEPGMYGIIAGQRRFQALQRLHAPTAACLVLPDLKEQDQEIVSLGENLHRVPLTRAQKVRSFSKLAELRGDDNTAALSKELSIGHKTLKQYLMIAKLPAEVISRLDLPLGEGGLTLGTAHSLVTFIDDPRFEQIVQTVTKLASKAERQQFLAKMVNKPEMDAEEAIDELVQEPSVDADDDEPAAAAASAEEGGGDEADGAEAEAEGGEAQEEQEEEEKKERKKFPKKPWVSDRDGDEFIPIEIPEQLVPQVRELVFQLTQPKVKLQLKKDKKKVAGPKPAKSVLRLK